jgi:CRP-like cAMP-binding protein
VAASGGELDILGDVSFLTENAASASVAALEQGSVVLAVPREIIAAHLTADVEFAARFYRMTATLLSERLRDLIALFITSPIIQTDTKAGPSLRGPVRLFDQNQPDFAAIERTVDSLPPLSDICNRLQQGISDNGAMAQRVQELSVATMATESLQLLLEIARDVGVTDLDRRVIRHKPSLSAADKQSFCQTYWSRKL